MTKRECRIGVRVETTAGIRQAGKIVSRFPWRDSTDGTYRDFGRRYVAVLWDDGTRGYFFPGYLAPFPTKRPA